MVLRGSLLRGLFLVNPGTHDPILVQENILHGVFKYLKRDMYPIEKGVIPISGFVVDLDPCQSGCLCHPSGLVLVSLP